MGEFEKEKLIQYLEGIADKNSFLVHVVSILGGNLSSGISEVKDEETFNLIKMNDHPLVGVVIPYMIYGEMSEFTIKEMLEDETGEKSDAVVVRTEQIGDMLENLSDMIDEIDEKINIKGIQKLWDEKVLNTKTESEDEETKFESIAKDVIVIKGDE